MKARFTHYREPENLFGHRLEAAINQAVKTDQIRVHAQTGDTRAWEAGEFTRCELTAGGVTFVGYAFCTQQFSRKLGRAIALGRAKKMLEKTLDAAADVATMVNV